MARAKLTALSVERAHRSGESVLLSDGDGLYLRKQTRDGASWTLRYHFAGRQHWLTLGNYPDMPLAQARIEARQARVLLDKRQDPLAVRRAALAEERQKVLFKSLCEDWYRAEVLRRAGSSTPPCRGGISRSTCCRKLGACRRVKLCLPTWLVCSMRSKSALPPPPTTCCASRVGFSPSVYGVVSS